MEEVVQKIAGIFGPIVLFVGLWTLFYKSDLSKLIESVEREPMSLYLLGIINLILGLGILNFYHEWSSSLATLVTLLGWVFFVRGIFCFFVPNFIHRMLSLQKNYTLFSGLLSVFWGGALCYLAFMQ